MEAIKLTQILGAIIVSVIIAVTFLVCLSQAFMAKDQTTISLLVGALIAAFTTVVQYWIGSSMGSQRKDEIIASKESQLLTDRLDTHLSQSSDILRHPRVD